jgi:shikimate kinase
VSLDLTEIPRLDLPYSNLVLTGFLGVGKTTIGRYIAREMGLDIVDVDEEIELREVMSIAKIREVYGDSRLRSLEHELCRHAALMRRSVVVVPGAALLDSRNYRLLNDTGTIIVLACELGEALRRLHLASEQHFRDHTIRRRMMSRLRREYAVIQDERLLQLDTTHLTIEEESELLVRTWLTGEPDDPRFRYGPPPPIIPPERPKVGISSRWLAEPPRGLRDRSTG